MNKLLRAALSLASALPGFWLGTAHAQLIINDTLTGASSSYNWLPFNGACLTAGNGTGSIPACSGLAYYKGETLVGGASGRLPDPVGSGALRLTNGDTKAGTNGNNNSGAVISNFTFPSNQGLQVTFTTVTYGGNGYNGTGADGMNFFLLDAGASGATAAPTALGAYGGSLGYTCSNVNGIFDGIANGYIGLGIDEFGNYANPGDNTNTGGGFSPGTISLRGAGNTNMAWLRANYPAYYSSGARTSAVQNTCKTGYLWNYSGGTITDANGVSVANGSQTTVPLAHNYNWIASSVLPTGTSIANQEAINTPLRGNATPITYNLSITNAGLMSLSYSINGGTAIPVMANQSIAASNGNVPGYYRFGFSAGTGGGSNVHEITCFKAAPVNQAQGSAGTNLQQSARLQTGSQVFLAFFHPSNWWGELTAQNLVYDPTTKLVSIQQTASWDASCVLTGGTCQATTLTNSAESPSSRTLLTWSGSAGIPFEWSNLSATQQAALTAGDAAVTSNRLLYLRGDRSNEVTTTGSGTFRVRTGVLGDIVGSSPSWVGAPADPYSGTWTDLLYPSATAPEASGQSYSSYQGSSSAATRQNIVYVGANDGFLHGFRTGAPGSTAPNDGLEVLAYMPSTALATIHSTTPALDFASPSYSHNFFVDATPATDDLYYNGAWHTWLVSGTGAGGNAGGAVASSSGTAMGNLFALDVTDPSQFSEANAASLVLGDWTSANLTCTNNAGCQNYLGSLTGTPIVRRLHNGQWAVLFGNGLNSVNGGAGLFIMLVDPATGARSFRYIDTGYGPSQAPAGASGKNGIAFVSSADLDGDHITDYVYAGDAFGNVWRFDLTSNLPANWSASAAPLFSTGGQPITTKIAVGSVPGIGPQGQSGVVFAFGTGRQFPQTLTGAATYASGTQYLYGVWDWNMAHWNSIAGATSQYASLAAPQSVGAANLQSQQILSSLAGSGSISGYRTVSTNPVCWSGSSACASGNNQFGWKLALPGGQEQVLYNPVISYGMFLVNTTIPAASQLLTCGNQPASGYTMAVTMGAGGAAPSSFFADGNNNYANVNGQIVSGIGLGATGSPSIVTAEGAPYLVQQTTKGTGSVTQINPAANATGSRVNWIRLR
ncbi:MAG: pilus assembly protein PilY [Burkholderiales bacterium]|nr:pilus assembly protein PilY [Burkholderiales bacterium]